MSGRILIEGFVDLYIKKHIDNNKDEQCKYTLL